MKRILSLILAAACLAGSLILTSCGEKKPEKPQNVFRETIVEMPAEIKGENRNVNINSTVLVGDTIYMMVYSYDRTTYQNKWAILPMSAVDGSFGEIISVEFAQTDTSSSNLNGFTADANGTLYLLVDTYTYSENRHEQKTELRRIKDGETETIELELYDEETEENFYVSGLTALDDGSLILQSWNGLRIMEPDGTIRPVTFDEEGDMQVQGIVRMDGKIYLNMWVYTETSSGTKLIEFNPADGSLGEELEINGNHAYNMAMGPGYDYYYRDTAAVWGVDTETGEMTEVVNFINSDINASYIRALIPLSADRFFYSYRVYPVSGSSYTELAFLDRVPQEEVVEKKLIRMAVDYMDYDLRGRVIEFNKANDTYRITIDDYSRYDTEENYQASTEKLNADIISGNMPDIFVITSGMPYDTYAAKGYFTDLYELMDADESFDRSLLLENVLKAYEFDGELLSLVPTFNIRTFVAKETLVEGMDGWTIDEFMAYASEHEDIQMFDYEFNRQNFIEMFMLFARDQFIDRETGKTYFDSDEFRSMLEFAKSLPEDDYWASLGDNTGREFWEEYENRFVEERVLLYQFYFSDMRYSYKDLLNYSLKAEPSFIGFPVEEGNGAAISANMELAISSRSSFKEGAWEFLKTLVSEEAMMPYYNDEYGYWEYPTYGIPIYKPALDKQIEIAMMPPEQEESGDVIIGGAATMPAIAVAETAAAATVEVVSEETSATEEGTSSDEIIDADGDGVADEPADKVVVEEPVVDTPAIEVPDVWVDPYSIPLTQEQVDKILALINGTTQVLRQDEDLTAIITEEAASYFAGDKTLDDTVNIIQNRAFIYVNEAR